ncbi:MAG: hypothetical protein IIC52_12105 [Proteobacteria bacterium]|nr:hypothetical protein [Pseudomonadota bacterium]
MGNVIERGIRKRGNSFQVDITRNGKRLSATCKSLEDARRKRAELQHLLYTDHGALEALRRRGKSWNLAEGAEYTGRIIWSKAVSGEKMKRLARDAMDFFGKTRPLNTITTESIDHWVLELEGRRLSDSTINHHLAALSRIMTIAMDRGGLDAKPKIPRKRQYQSRMRIVSVKEDDGDASPSSPNGF